MQHILQYANLDSDLLSDDLCDLDVLRSRLLVLNRQKWLLDTSNKTKLRTFLQIYNEEDPRSIVESLLTRSQRSIVSKLKNGVLPLHIEMGRWKDKPLEHRTCPDCDSKCLKDEFHFLLKCEAYDDTREEFFQVLVDKDIEVDTKTEAGFVKSILGKEALRTSGKYLERMYKERREKVNVK